MELETLLLKIYVLENIDQTDIIDGIGIYPKNRLQYIVNDMLKLKYILKEKKVNTYLTEEGKKELIFLRELHHNMKLISRSI